MLYNSLKDVTWSTTTLPLDRLVSAYRLPQIVKLDSGKVCPELCWCWCCVQLRVGGRAPVEFQSLAASRARLTRAFTP